MKIHFIQQPIQDRLMREARECRGEPVEWMREIEEQLMRRVAA